MMTRLNGFNLGGSSQFLSKSPDSRGGSQLFFFKTKNWFQSDELEPSDCLFPLSSLVSDVGSQKLVWA